jgi:hypothetical protein
MIRFYTNRELSTKLRINLAKWKRWSREFLPPDPLGGLQSGYARQYNLGEAFTTALGGHLVGHLKFSVPEAKCIISDLDKWLRQHDFLAVGVNGRKEPPKDNPEIQEYRVYILKQRSAKGIKLRFAYVIRGIVAREVSQKTIPGLAQPVRSEHFVQWTLQPSTNPERLVSATRTRLLNLSQCYADFCDRLV